MSVPYKHPLILVTPHMTGQRVKDAQWLMKGNNRHKNLAPYKDGIIDGDYGLITAQATKRTKFWLGYPLASCDMVFGSKIYAYLVPSSNPAYVPLPDDYKKRRNERIAAALVTPGSKALAKAITQLGYKETYKNLTKYGEWYHFNGVPWCAIFESWCFSMTGRSSYHYAAVENIYDDAIHGRNGLSRVFMPRPGDVVCFNLHGDRFAHTAFFEKWLDKSSGSFQDLGGNTGPTNISNGGMVARGTRDLSMVTAFVRAN